ncbi:MFS transporter [Nonomuraea helvata]|uniref:MFS transporter n=1 Tax=Nonomuraea helvata TaxID=37484 RepID=A0ABV5SHB9_9ACTN
MPENFNGRRWLVLAVVSAAQFLTVLDLWVANIALPTLRRDFAPATLADVSWILDVYAIVVAALLIPAGRVADSAGRRTCFLAGLVVFGAASLGCALAPTLPVLIAGRMAQAVGAAVLMPTSLGLALSAFPERERGTAVGVWAAVGAAAAGAGPVLGGLLVEWNWRWIFLINVPLVAVTVAAGPSILPRDGARRSGRRVGAVGALLVFGAVGLVCTALTELPAWPPVRTEGVLAAGLILAAGFAVHVARSANPVVSPQLFTSRAFRAGVAGLVAYYVGFAALLLGTTLLLTGPWRVPAVAAAAGIAPGPVAAGLLAPFSGRVAARFGRRGTILAGAALFAAAALWLLAGVGPVPAYLSVVLPAMVLWGLANGLIQPSLFAAADTAPPAELASGSALLSMARQLGSALGVAILVAALGTGPSADPTAFDRAWLVVLAAAVLTAAAALGAERRAELEVRTPAERGPVASGRRARP